jgi:hypothetical protein
MQASLGRRRQGPPRVGLGRCGPGERRTLRRERGAGAGRFRQRVVLVVVERLVELGEEGFGENGLDLLLRRRGRDLAAELCTESILCLGEKSLELLAQLRADADRRAPQTS